MFVERITDPLGIEPSAKEGVLAEIEEATEMKPEEYLTYFEDFIFVADKEFG